MRKRADLRKTLRRLDRSLKLYRNRIHADALWTVNSNDEMQMIDVSREIVRLRSALSDISQELTLVSRQMYVLTMNKARCVPISRKTERTKAPAVQIRKQNQAFAAIPSVSGGGVVIGIRQNVAGFSFQQQYGSFETWTEAQAFAALLNERLGVTPFDAMEVMISSDLATKATGGKQRASARIFLNP